ncbi:MAG: phage holin family protein [Halioglobus sp.]|nr:phage holin family protein [Halioglobus sp.]
MSALVRNEVDLARTEVHTNLDRAGTALGVLVGAVIIALTALNVLVAALVAGLVELGVDNGVAALLVGAVLAVIAYAMTREGLQQLKVSRLAPTRTAENLQRHAKAVKEVYHG